MIPNTNPVGPSSSDGGPNRPRRFGTSWIWPTLAIVLIGASAIFRGWQSSRIEAAAESVEVAPFPLSEVPKQLGTWKAIGGDEELEADILEIAGASDYLSRNYIDERTGQEISVLIVFGPAEEIVGHTPVVCYPAVGFQPSDKSQDHRLGLKLEHPIRFRSTVFTKGEGSVVDREEVYWAFRHQGIWSPTAQSTRKSFRTNPAMFKVQVQRRVNSSERRGLNNPSEALLEQLVPFLEQKITETDSANPAAAASI